jgi:hypothetical protein
MNQQGIHRIAEAVVASLADGSGPGLLGCGAISSDIAYSSDELLACQVYECGGEGLFTCCQGFTCFDDFTCAEGAPYGCTSRVQFTCLTDFACGQQFSIQDCP